MIQPMVCFSDPNIYRLIIVLASNIYDWGRATNAIMSFDWLAGANWK
jgi:hypothetical protein